jgi:type II secretory pathway pseudopilin PulG
MKHNLRERFTAFTRLELTVVLVIFGLLAAMLVPDLARRARARARTTCANNLKLIGTAYRLFPENVEIFPAMTSVGDGGWSDFLTNADQGAICWTNYAILTNELGLDTKLVVCPSDQRRPATNFTTDFKDNTHLSYFVGVSASYIYPQSILGGDRNLGPGKVPDANYGYSPTNGKGNDVAVPISGPVSWSLKMHSAGNAGGAGNILLGDGSAQQCSSDVLSTKWLTNAESPTTWPAGHIPATPSIRLVFP